MSECSKRLYVECVLSEDATDKDGSSSKLKIFIAFQLFGLFGILITLLTVTFSHSTPRHAAWYSFAISWVISTVAYTLLFWGGHFFSGSDPPFTLCLIQGVMIYASPPLTAFTTLALVVQVWWILLLDVPSNDQMLGVQARQSPMTLTMLLILPYLLFVTILVGSLILGVEDPSIVKRVSASKMYCNFTNRIPGRISTALCALLLIPVAILEARICRALHQQWPLFKRAPYALSMVFRVASFTLLGLMALVFSLIFFFDVHHGGALDIVLSLCRFSLRFNVSEQSSVDTLSVPVLAVLIFGTQSDILRAWMFWKKPKPAETVNDGEEEKDLPESPKTIIIIRVGGEAREQ
ncbi:hypothetical protein C0995_000205 [Termitomyces sp. Mi166|nr:hypothetical protein C0995_000205 [Termitomyces sp. Mi166\